MSSRINVLQLGPTDFSKEYQIHEDVKWFYEVDLTHVKLKMFDVVILSRNINEEERELLFTLSKAYCVFIYHDFVLGNETLWLAKSKKANFVRSKELEKLLKEDIVDYYPKPYGEKYDPHNLAIKDNFKGNVIWKGYNGVTLEGEFGEDFIQIAYWRNSIPVFQNQSIDFWLEYEKTGNVEIKLCITQFVSGSVCSIQNTWEFDEEQMKDIVYITNEKKDGPIFVSIKAKGSGSLKIVGLHDRYSRRGKGAFLPGGERKVTSKREEIFFYFDPGDMKPPLNVYFSGYKTQEGFEGYNMMRKMGCPFLLISESRLEGGAFYLGDEEYEQLMVESIDHYLEELGFSSEQMIMSGLSMGTFGALYYGCDFKPSAIIVGKPLASIGDVANNERINRPGGFPTSLDVLFKQYSSLDEESVQKLNKRFWDKFDNVSWDDTRFIVSYMIEDDYDSTAYPTLLSHINNDFVEVYSKGIHGRHNDNTGGIVSWFIAQYNALLKTCFEREFE